ncbi:MAG TPA: carboxypeptidase-like regulatory domain-containing protein, partial [Bryobacterales bacterium]|nr:carboxypeptidase-like regulatory domain-containing protein [Bryobacterales bacterium]
MKSISVRFFVGSLLAAACAIAQVNTASLTGLVRDSSGGVIPNATVTAKSKTTGAEQRVTTDQTGYYAFSSLPAGDYTLTAEQTGFNREVRDLSLDPSQ